MMLAGAGANEAIVSTMSKTPPTTFTGSRVPSGFFAVKNLFKALAPAAAVPSSHVPWSHDT